MADRPLKRQKLSEIDEEKVPAAEWAKAQIVDLYGQSVADDLAPALSGYTVTSLSEASCDDIMSNMVGGTRENLFVNKVSCSLYRRIHPEPAAAPLPI